MSREYGDPVYGNAIEAAIALTIALASQRPSSAVGALARQAVDAVFCTCVTSAADAVANGEAPVHAGLIAEVRQQAERRGMSGDGSDRR